MTDSVITEFESVQRAFSKQAEHYDMDDQANSILATWRIQVYSHVNNYLKPESSILELNSGTGIDALHFLHLGHAVHATDLSQGMIQKIQEKIGREQLQMLTCQQCSFEALHQVTGRKFDYVFSNFGGLNCSKDLSKITAQLHKLLNPGAYVTWVIMPKVSPWEIFRALKGKRNAFRRFKKGGVLAHLEGEYFKTYYHSLEKIEKAFGEDFRLMKTEGLGVTAPPPSAMAFTSKNPRIASVLKKIDSLVRGYFPFNRWGDHIIVTFQYLK